MNFGSHDPEDVIVVGSVAVPVRDGGPFVDIEISVRVEEAVNVSAGTFLRGRRDLGAVGVTEEKRSTYSLDRETTLVNQPMMVAAE